MVKLYVCQQGNSFIIWYIHTVEYWAAKKRKEVKFFEMTQKITVKILTGKFFLNSRLNVVDLIFLKIGLYDCLLVQAIAGKILTKFFKCLFRGSGGKVPYLIPSFNTS